MTPAELAVLAAEIQDDPMALGYSVHLPDDPQRVVDLLTAQNYTMIKSRYVTVRTILAECDDGAAIMDQLEAAAANVSAVRWMMTFLQQNSGMDAGHPKTQKNIDDLVTATMLQTKHAAQLKALASQPAARYEVVGIPQPTARDIVDALEIK